MSAILRAVAVAVGVILTATACGASGADSGPLAGIPDCPHVWDLNDAPCMSDPNPNDGIASVVGTDGKVRHFDTADYPERFTGQGMFNPTASLTVERVEHRTADHWACVTTAELNRVYLGQVRWKAQRVLDGPGFRGYRAGRHLVRYYRHCGGGATGVVEYLRNGDHWILTGKAIHYP